MFLQYRVIPIQKASVSAGFENLVDPQDTEASPKGWHTSSSKLTTS